MPFGDCHQDGEVSDIVKESSAARNGMLTEHAVLEIDGQNVVGMKDKDIAKVIEDAPVTVTVTIMPGKECVCARVRVRVCVGL